MPLRFNVKIKTNLDLINAIQDLINDYKENIHNVTTQYIHTDKTLYQVSIQFDPVWVEMEEEDKDER